MTTAVIVDIIRTPSGKGKPGALCEGGGMANATIIERL
jgi:hypothetical protein